MFYSVNCLQSYLQILELKHFLYQKTINTMNLRIKKKKKLCFEKFFNGK